MPGPYEYYDNYGFNLIAKNKSVVSGSVFLSESIRLPYGDYENRLGPNFDNLGYKNDQKKSFLLNFEGKWV